MDNKNNNTSIPHVYTYKSMRTRAYESPVDELRLLRNYPESHARRSHGHLTIATTLGPRRPRVASRCGSSPRYARASHDDTRGHMVAHNASARVADISRANRYFRAEFQRKRHAGTIASLEKVLFVGPDVKRGFM